MSLAWKRSCAASSRARMRAETLAPGWPALSPATSPALLSCARCAASLLVMDGGGGGVNGCAAGVCRIHYMADALASQPARCLQNDVVVGRIRHNRGAFHEEFVTSPKPATHGVDKPT
ncbi:hypothetical protein CBM2623_B140117 [Cupriavidus taiwanensis]|nr:hypothetical protein CBM2608_B130245 [Cupriavidus taiwanensis]SPA32362.1 hypothetical protein CBM2623_B140117 [Cupriavidus taiwanensis]SPA51818.1 hypothetical protein CBM2629_B130087 [Cupriavidus taiwanensis]